MKKLIYIGLIISIVFAFCSCGNKTVSENIDPTPIYALIEKTEYGEKTTYSDYQLDEKGRIISYKENGLTTVTLEYDDNGNNVSKKEESHYGYNLYSYTYNDNGELIREECKSDFSIEDGKVFVYTYEYDSAGRVTKKHSEALHADYPMDYIYQYNTADELITEKQISNNSTYEITYEYDENGNMQSAVVANKDSGSKDYQKYVYEIVGYYPNN